MGSCMKDNNSNNNKNQKREKEFGEGKGERREMFVVSTVSGTS